MTDDANRQDMSVHDKENPALGPTVEAQDMSRLDRIVVPPGAYTDPNNPSAASGSVNFAVETHPAVIANDYGAGVQNGEDDVRSTADVHSLEMQQVVTGDANAGGTEAPEDRDEWTKAHWHQRAEELGLAVGGNKETLKNRVEEHEGAIAEASEMSAEDWKSEIESADDEELADLRRLYEQSGASYSTVEDAFEKKAADNGAGNGSDS